MLLAIQHQSSTNTTPQHYFCFIPSSCLFTQDAHHNSTSVRPRWPLQYRTRSKRSMHVGCTSRLHTTRRQRRRRRILLRQGDWPLRRQHEREQHHHRYNYSGLVALEETHYGQGKEGGQQRTSQWRQRGEGSEEVRSPLIAICTSARPLFLL